MARGFSCSGKGIVYTKLFTPVTTGFIEIVNATFDESTGNITIVWDLGFNCSGGTGGVVSAAAPIFGGVTYDSEYSKSSGESIYYGSYMVHAALADSNTQGKVIYNAGTWSGKKVLLNDHTHVVDYKTKSLTYAVTAQMNFGWGWNRWVNGTGRYGPETTGTLTFTLPQYDVTYNENSGNTKPDAQLKDYGTNLTLRGAISRAGYTFSGWKDSDGTVYSASGTYSKNKGTTMTAQWTPNTYYIYYNANGGSNAPATQSYTYAGSGTVSLSTSEPTRTGYTFLGWSTDANATSATYESGASWNRSIRSNTTLYAVWRINQYYLDVNGRLDGSSYSNIGSYGTFDVTVNGTLTANNVNDYYSAHNYNLSYSVHDIQTKSGYQYNGVYSGSTSGNIAAGSNTVVLNFSTIPPDEVTLNAVATGPFTISLSWNSTGINTTYTLYYKKAGASTYTAIDKGSSKSHTLTTEEETTYNIYVKATNPGGSDTSTTSTVLTPADQAKVRIKQGQTWAKGKLWFKLGDSWVKAKKVYIKQPNGSWAIGYNYENN